MKKMEINVDVCREEETVKVTTVKKEEGEWGGHFELFLFFIFSIYLFNFISSFVFLKLFIKNLISICYIYLVQTYRNILLIP